MYVSFKKNLQGTIELALSICTYILFLFHWITVLSCKDIFDKKM